jgi:hypothetical protein
LGNKNPGCAARPRERYRRTCSSPTSPSRSSQSPSPPTPFGVLTGAALLPDLCGRCSVVTGVEHVEIELDHMASTPLTLQSLPHQPHLLTMAMWAALLASTYFAVRGYRSLADRRSRRTEPLVPGCAGAPARRWGRAIASAEITKRPHGGGGRHGAPRTKIFGLRRRSGSHGPPLCRCVRKGMADPSFAAVFQADDSGMHLRGPVFAAK